MSGRQASEARRGLCWCGCGEATKIATRTDAKRGDVKGEPRRYVIGHAAGRLREPVAEERGHATPCLIWQGAISPSGYGAVRHEGRTRRAHRVAYEREVGPIPPGLDLDHLCRVRLCVNPEHLEPVTRGENLRRGYAARRALRVAASK